MTKNEKDIQKLMHRYFEGKTTPAETAELMRWTGESPDHERMLLRERKLYDISLLRTDEMQTPQVVKLHPHLAWTLRAAAILILMLLTGVGGMWFSQTQQPEPTLSTIVVPKGQYVELTLSDDTHVWLNGGSRFTYPSSFGRGAREVALNGEGYFEVSHDKKHPFRISHYAGMVEVLGTTFDLIADSARAQYETALVEGHVRMSTNDHHAIELHSRQRALLADGRLTRVRYEEGNTFDWRKGLISFRQRSFMDIIEELEHNYDISIEVRHPERFQQTYTGKFRREDGVEYALRVLQHDVPFSFKKTGDQLLIY